MLSWYKSNVGAVVVAVVAEGGLAGGAVEEVVVEEEGTVVEEGAGAGAGAEPLTLTRPTPFGAASYPFVATCLERACAYSCWAWA